MCDYSLHEVASRPAKIGETLITTTFRGAGTRGFAAEAEPEVAVCLLPGTELAFADAVSVRRRLGLEKEYERQSCSFSQSRARCFISAS